MNLVPGMQFNPVLPMPRGMNVKNTFIVRCSHPFYEGFQLVVWRLADGTISLDALSPLQDVGEPAESTPTERRENLRKAIHGKESG